MDKLAQRLQLVRSHFGYTQAQMAEKIKVKYRSWQDYERGKNIPGGKVLEGIALLGINTNWVLTGHGPMHNVGRSGGARHGLLDMVAAAMREVILENAKYGCGDTHECIADAFTQLYGKLSAQPHADICNYLLAPEPLKESRD